MMIMHNAVLVLFLVAALSKQASAACSLCFDGEEITRPSYALGLKDPITINTCQDLVNVLAFIPEDDALCSAARSVSTLCGCPNLAPNACTICDSMTRPLQNLEGLVDLGDVEYFGLTPTCALFESGINVFQKEDQDCSVLPMEDLQLYCGCASDENESNSACTLCPGGEIVPDDPQHDFFYLLLNSNEVQISCSEAKELVKEEEPGSTLCTDIQRGSTVCGCPVSENACQLCPGGEISSQFERLDTIFGVRQDCITFDNQLKSLNADSEECQLLDDSYREICGCQEETPFVPCTLCPLGEPVPYPDKRVVGMQGMGYDYLEPTCGVFEQAARIGDENDLGCSSARILARVCGCAVPEMACTLCENGDLPHPFREYLWAFGTVADSFPQFYETVDFRERKFRCEMADTFLSAAYKDGDDFCYFNQLIRGTGCGCEGPINTKVIALVWCQRCSGLLSLVGSLTIIVFVLTKKTRNRWNTYNQLVLAISVFDSLSSLAYIFGTALTPADIGMYGSIGNEGTCLFQGT